MRDIHEAPPAFNPEFREGFGEALSAEYSAWSLAHPDHSREEGMMKYQEIANRIKADYPSVAEKGEYPCVHGLILTECVRCYK